ncbi:hypothetical protein AOL_s00075g243 [Orbilia oligospora ATCC 24927]|uniref:Uncharacterized protein n=2 Tax=Orbilia oligospora TaxID=2813651 RepID=G1X8P4_ARTOA|nr:hypothetical protein AOL_s00075g243 [Orbilia oligospora ATCC 24927]EGX50514.1 hypothetical protein AOL_s00075g243 [Orbilia oligospora ATCC 24927]KAF3279576.1 hypothetical protein TWF970_004118 [Orbilia oligospora]KAF3279577.1 hypothetical protein TWF970_004118 [Orbilia oligospora]
MVDTENEKAEKLAAAKKRFEELKRKKQPNKKASGSAKEPPSNNSPLLEASHHDITTTESGGNDVKQQGLTNTDQIQAIGDGEDAIKDKDTEQLNELRADNGQPESHSTTTNEALLETLPEIYRKQASVIDELRTDNQQLLDEVKTLQVRAQECSKAIVDRDKALEDLASVSEELQLLKEKSGVEQATLLEGAGEVNALKMEVASLSRQIAHLQSQIAQKDKTIIDMRRNSTLSSPGSDETVKQEERIESMSVELSKSRAELEASVASTDTLRLERDRLETLVESMKVELETATRNTDDLSNKLSRLTESVTSDSAKNSAWEEKSRSQGQTIIELNQKLDVMKSTVDQLKQSNQELRASERDMEARYRDIEKRLSNAQRENSGMQLRLAELKSSLHGSLNRTDLPINTDLPGVDSREGGGNGEVRNSNRVQGDTEGNKLGPKDHLWRQVLADENSHDFLDIDLQTVARNTTQSQNILDHPLATPEGDQERRSLIQRARKELESWRGHRINLIDVYLAYDDTYSRIFDI